MAVLLGSREPTFEIAPEYWSNAAQEPIELMASLGRPGSGWQCDTLRLWSGQRRDGAWAAFLCFVWTQRQNGKGWCLEARGLGGLFIWGESKITYSAHRLKTVKSHFKRVRELVDSSDDLTRRVRKIVDNNNERFIQLMSGAQHDFVVRSGGGGGRGESGPVQLLDEALYLKQEDLEAQGPTVLAMPDAQVILASTPPETAESHIVAIRARAHAGEARMAGAEWTNPPGTDPDDEEARARVNPEYGRRITSERMADVRGLLGPDGFLRECIGVWPGDEARKWLLVPKAAWTGQERSDSAITGALVLVVTTQRPERSWSAVTAAGHNAAGERHVEWVAYRPGTRWVVPYLEERVRRHRPVVLVVDDKDLAGQAEAAKLAIYRPTAGDAVTAATGFLSGVADPDLDSRDIVHIGQDELTGAAAVAIPRSVGQLWAFGSNDPTVDISPLVGVALAAWALDTPRIHTPAKGVRAAVVDTGPRGAPPAAAAVDVNTQRLLEQIQRDLNGGGATE